MGKYINKNSKGEILPIRNRAIALIADGARPCDPQIGAVCVVQNGAFDAVAWVYNQREVTDFTDPEDKRPKTWLWYDHAEQLAD